MPLTSLTRVTSLRCARATSQPARKQENIRTVSASGPVHGPGEAGSGQVPFRAAVGEGDSALWRSAAALRGPASATLHDNEHGVAPARIPADMRAVTNLAIVGEVRAE
jgi:hypothetical protein